MARECGLKQISIRRIAKTCRLKPLPQENFKLSADSASLEKVCDVVGLYLNPPEQTRTMVLCVDEKSRVQALERPPAALSHQD